MLPSDGFEDWHIIILPPTCFFLSRWRPHLVRLRAASSLAVVPRGAGGCARQLMLAGGISHINLVQFGQLLPGGRVVLGRADKFVIPSETTRPMSILPPHCAYLLSRWRPRHWSARHRPTVAPSALVLRPQVVWLPYTAARSREDFSCRGFRNAGIVFSFYHAQANVPK